MRYDDGESDGNVTISTEMQRPSKSKNIPNMTLGLQVSAVKKVEVVSIPPRAQIYDKKIKKHQAKLSQNRSSIST